MLGTMKLIIPQPLKVQNSEPIKAKSQMFKTIKNRVLTIYKDNNWVQKIDLPNGKIKLGIGDKIVYSQ